MTRFWPSLLLPPTFRACSMGRGVCTRRALERDIVCNHVHIDDTDRSPILFFFFHGFHDHFLSVFSVCFMSCIVIDAQAIADYGCFP